MSKEVSSVFDQMVENAIDFLERAASEIEQDPKFAILHLATAVEILIKARIADEHWSIIVKQKPDRDQFLLGNFTSISLKESIEILDRVIGMPLKKEAMNSFIALSNHRNQIVHFHNSDLSKGSESKLDSIASDVFGSIYYVNKFLLENQQEFAKYNPRLQNCFETVKVNQRYLSKKFEDLRSAIEDRRAKGAEVLNCNFCSYHAAIASKRSGPLSNLECVVCENLDGLVTICCPNEDCGIDLHYRASDGFQIRNCSSCGYLVEQSDLVDTLDTRSPYDEDCGPINCGECGTPDIVVELTHGVVCCECFAIADGAVMCGWCSEQQLGGGDMEYSHWSGCEFCDGRSGWERD